MESIDINPINKDNFFENTKGAFQYMESIPSRSPDFISTSGSFYWHGSDDKGDFVIRHANHWTGKLRCKKIKTCIWSINSDPEVHKGNEIIQLERRGRWIKKKVQKRVCGICWFVDMEWV